ncbi:hypothetical protein [Pasteurella sp. PK-2025]|uniref:hypothetical protein n=1 Tax=Pasteurella sp. PK-2025 TaxID=3413133 RepID=UPI003C791D4C
MSKINLKIKRGDTFAHRFSLFKDSENKVPFNLSDVARIDLQAIADDEVVLSLSTTNSTLIIKDNYLLMLVSKKLTQGKMWEDGEYDVQVTYNDNVTKTIASGKIKLEHDVTESKVAEDETSFERAIEFAMQNQASEIVVSQESMSLVFGMAVKGDKGDDGQDGATFIPHLSSSGDLSFSNNKGLDNPQAVNIKGQKGDTGESAYDLWKRQGNSGELSEFLESLKGKKGLDGNHGKSAYQIWLDLQNQGTEQDFINSLKGNKGDNGVTFTPSLAENGELSFTNNGSLENPNPVNLKGVKGDRGDDGATFTPTVSEIGELSWSNNKGLPNPPPINIKGERGDSADTSSLIAQIQQLSEKNKDLETRLNRLEVKFGTHDRAIGRNYILNSEHFDRFYSNNGSLYPITTGKDGKGNWISGTSNGKYQISTYSELLSSFQYFSEDLSNQVVTISADVMATYDCDIRLDSGAKVRLTANTWKRISATNSGTRMTGIYVENVNATVGSGAQFRLYHKNWKLEKGNKATDWIPA